MEKRILLGVQKKKKPTKRNKKRFLKKAVDYLKSDFYMYRPFISSSPARFPAQEVCSFSSSTSNTVKIGQNKRLLDNVGDYLKSDLYMYAPLFASRPITSPKGCHVLEGMLSSEVCALLGELGTISHLEIMKLMSYAFLKANAQPAFQGLHPDFCILKQKFIKKCHPAKHKGSRHARYLKKVTMEASARISNMNMKKNRSTVESSNLAVKDQFSEGNILPERSI